MMASLVAACGVIAICAGVIVALGMAVRCLEPTDRRSPAPAGPLPVRSFARRSASPGPGRTTGRSRGAQGRPRAEAVPAPRPRNRRRRGSCPARGSRLLGRGLGRASRHSPPLGGGGGTETGSGPAISVGPPRLALSTAPRRSSAQPGLPSHGADAMTARPNPSGDARSATADKPPIQVTTWDYGRLSAVVDAFQRRGREPLVDLLAEELDRAELVEPAAIPRDVVTMHSCVDVRRRRHRRGAHGDAGLPGRGGQPPRQGRRRHAGRQRPPRPAGRGDDGVADPGRPDQAPVGARGQAPAGGARLRRGLRRRPGSAPSGPGERRQQASQPSFCPRAPDRRRALLGKEEDHHGRARELRGRRPEHGGRDAARGGRVVGPRMRPTSAACSLTCFGAQVRHGLEVAAALGRMFAWEGIVRAQGELLPRRPRVLEPIERRNRRPAGSGKVDARARARAFRARRREASLLGRRPSGRDGAGRRRPDGGGGLRQRPRLRRRPAAVRALHRARPGDPGRRQGPRPEAGPGSPR